MKRTLSTCLSAGIPESCSSWKRNPVKFSSSQGLRFTTARTPLSASTPVLVVLDPVLSQLRRPVRHFALRVTCQIVEVQNLYDNLAGNAESEMSHWSPQLRKHWIKNHKDWGRCGEGCPCSGET